MKTKELKKLKCPICPLGSFLTSDGKEEPIYGDCCFPNGLVTESKYQKLLKQREKMKEALRKENELRIPRLVLQIQMLPTTDRKILYDKLGVKEK